MTLSRITARGDQERQQSLAAIIGALHATIPALRRCSVHRILTLVDDLSGRLVRDERTRGLEGIMFLSSWLRMDNLQKVLDLNLNGNPEYLDRFVPHGRSYLAARPHGLVAMWMAGNVGTLPLFSIVPALLTKNVSLVKVAAGTSEAMAGMLAVLADSHGDGIDGSRVAESVAAVSFDHGDRSLNDAMSLAADARIMWGGEAAIRGIASLPHREHCADIVFGPKYSFGIIDRKLQDREPEALDRAIGSFVRDIAIFDQRACSAPQTIFVERSGRYPLRAIGEIFARHLRALRPKANLDAYTTMRILNTRAAWALDGARDVIASDDGANWTVCLDEDVSMKEAVQSRTIFLTAVTSWREVIPLISHKLQTVGIAFDDAGDAMEFAEAATGAGVVRCVRPGLMNVYESPWDGKLLINQLVRWVTLKP